MMSEEKNMVLVVVYTASNGESCETLLKNGNKNVVDDVFMYKMASENQVNNVIECVDNISS